MPHCRQTVSATYAEPKQATKKNHLVFLKLKNSRANIPAANGVPNTPANPALMPIQVNSLCSCLFKLNHLFIWLEILAPIWTAVPSRPAAPPPKCVSKVPKKTSGVNKKGIVSLCAGPLSFSISCSLKNERMINAFPFPKSGLDLV